jgi:protoporphyrinogen oxidase
MKKIAIIGGGITGLTLAYYLSKKYKVVIFEKNKQLGGLASSFKNKGWKWSLEHNYHHVFDNDHTFINLCNEIGLEKDLFYKTPKTSSLYKMGEGTIQVDNPIDLLRFPGLGIFDKLRVGMTVVMLKLIPFRLRSIEKTTSIKLLTTFMGRLGYSAIFEELFRKKFGKYAGIISGIFIWSRIKKRTQSLGYINGGFEKFITQLSKKNIDRGVVIKNGGEVSVILPHFNKYLVEGEEFDLVVSTVPTPTLMKIATPILSKDMIDKAKKIKYLHSMCLVIETKKPYFEVDYWMNVMDKKSPFMVLVQHTNLIDKKNYSGNHILYVGVYTDDKKLLNFSQHQLYEYYRPSLSKINPSIKKEDVVSINLFTELYSQPIYDSNYLDKMLPYEIVRNKFYCANLDQTYPYDRGINYAVSLGQRVARLINKSF